LETLDCSKCPDIVKHRTCIVCGKGPQNARVMLVGEAPGRYEDRVGAPFVGPAGKILDGLLKIAELPRDKIYITNAVKCRPVSETGGNRSPTVEEVQNCSPKLFDEIEKIRPKLIVTLGRVALSAFKQTLYLSTWHGKVLSIEGIPARIIPLYHPASTIYNPDLLPVLQKDMEIVRLLSQPDVKEYFFS